MSVLTYNGVTVGPLWLTSNFTQEAVYSGDGANTDFMFTKYVMEGQAYLSALVPPGTSSDTPVDIVKTRMRQQFMTPRKGISFKVNGKELLPSPGTMASTTDAQSGPTPKFFNLMQLQEKTFIATLRVEASFIEGSTSPVISHRWSDSATIDSNYYTQKTRDGTIRIRSDENAYLDQLRDACVTTALSPGFVRKSARYTVEPSGLALSYSLSDQEVYLMPPQPATEADGEYVENTPLGQPFRTAQVTVRLKGAKIAPKADLIRQAVLICVTKLRGADVFAARGISLMGGSVRESLWKNEIEVTMQARLKPNRRRQGTNAIDLRRFVQPPRGSEPGTPPPDYGIRGTAGVLLQAAAYNDKTLAGTLNKQSNQLNVPNPATDIPGGGGNPLV